MSQQDIALVLREIVEKRRRENSRLSLRFLAQKIGISSGRLSELISGKRTLTVYYLEKIVASLKLDENEVETIKKVMGVFHPHLLSNESSETGSDCRIDIKRDLSSLESSISQAKLSFLERKAIRFENEVSRILTEGGRIGKFSISISIRSCGLVTPLQNQKKPEFQQGQSE